MRRGRGWAFGVGAREARRAVAERRGRRRRRRVGGEVLGVGGEVGEVVVERVEEEAMVKGLRRSFSQGLVMEVGGRLR